MKSMIKILLCILLITSCNFEEESPVVDETPAKNFIKQYCYLKSLNPGLIIESEDEYLNISDFTIFPFSLKAEDNESDYYTLASKEEFTELSAQNNDTTFEGSMALIFPGMVSVNSLSQIDIVTESDYNETLISGNSINSIVEITYMDPKTYINNGYRFDTKSEEQEISWDDDKMTFTTTLDEFNISEHPLIAFDMIFLKLKEQPSLNGEYKFTITYTDEKGNKYTGITPSILIKGKSN